MIAEQSPRDRDERRRRKALQALAPQIRQPPDFVIIGAQKGGTTSLYRYLTEHPDIGGATKKEVHFFDRFFDKGMNWYLDHFPERNRYAVVGESSPSYLFFPEVPGRVQAAVPAAKLIVLLRNPIDRAHSQYHMRSRLREQPETFEEALDEELARLASGNGVLGPTQGRPSYLARGIYHDQLRRWFAVFPRQQMLILRSEAFFDRPEESLHQTLAFLGLAPGGPTRFEVHNSAAYPDMRPDTRVRLAEFFAPHNRRLYDLLDWDLGWNDA